VKTVICIFALAGGAFGAWTYEGQWGSEGYGYGRFDYIWDITVSPRSGNVYVADTENDHVQYFTATGSFLGQWGNYGSGNGDFDYPSGVAISPLTGNVYVSEYLNHRVQYFTATGKYLGQWGTWGTGNGEFK